MPIFAAFFGVVPGLVRAVRLAETTPSMAVIWDQAAEKYGPRPQRFADVAVWPYGDHLVTPHWDMVSSIEKLCRFGFIDAVDTQASVLHAFAALGRN